MATIRKRSSRYEVQVRRKGFASLTRSFSRYADAKEWARKVEGQADRHDLAPSRKVLDQITLADLVIRYRDTVVPSLKGAAGETIVLNAFLRQPMCRKTLAELTTADFAAYRDAKLKTVTAKSLARMLSPIRHMFRIARDEWDLPLEDPLRKLRLRVVDNKRQRRLQAGEMERLMVLCRNLKNPYVSLVIQFAHQSAMRRGEILALRWSDVDIERATVTILEAKNGYSRVIPLAPAAMDLLGQAKALQDGGQERVFPLSANGFRLAWERLVKRAGIRDLHFHDLRHEAISRLFELGLTAPEVASISGHRDMRMLFRYAHASNEAVRAKLNAAPGTSI